MSSLACCFVDDETPYCVNRRFETLPMCQKHMAETMRTAIFDALMPWDVMRELVKFTQQAIEVRQLSERFAIQHEAFQDRVARGERAAETKHTLGVVYYVRLSGDRIKIGRTTNLKRRMGSMRIPSHDVLAAEPGGIGVEADRHAEFAHIRHGRLEDFDATPELLAHVESIRATWGNPWTLKP